MGLGRWSGLLLDRGQRKELKILLPVAKNPHAVRNEYIRDNAEWCIRANIYKHCSRSPHGVCTFLPPYLGSPWRVQLRAQH